MLMKRDDYKTVKRMDRIQMSAYLERIYRRGYEAGANSMRIAKKENVEADVSASVEAVEPPPLAPAT